MAVAAPLFAYPFLAGTASSTASMVPQSGNGCQPILCIHFLGLQGKIAQQAWPRHLQDFLAASTPKHPRHTGNPKATGNKPGQHFKKQFWRSKQLPVFSLALGLAFPFGKTLEGSPSNCPSVVPCRLWLQGGDGGLQLLENGVRDLARSHLHLLRW